MLEEATAFAPATVANLGPGFDWLGCAVEVRSCFAEACHPQATMFKQGHVTAMLK